MENDSLVLWGLLAMLVLSVFSLFAVYNVESVSEQEMREAVMEEVAKVKVPSAEEVASLVVMPELDFEVPEFKGEKMVKDLWENLYSVEIAELKDYAYNDSLDELMDDDYEALEDWLKLNVEGFDDLEDVDFDDYKVEVVELGLEEDEDKVAKVVFELEVEYDLMEGPNDHSYDKDLVVTAEVSYEEGDYSEEDVKFSYAFAE